MRFSTAVHDGNTASSEIVGKRKHIPVAVADTCGLSFLVLKRNLTSGSFLQVGCCVNVLQTWNPTTLGLAGALNLSPDQKSCPCRGASGTSSPIFRFPPERSDRIARNKRRQLYSSKRQAYFVHFSENVRHVPKSKRVSHSLK